MASVATPSRTLSELAELDRAHLIHPNLSGAIEERCVLVRGEGCLLWDADGTEYLDATGGLWLCQIGHGRREIAKAAAEQMERLEYFTSFWDFSNDQSISLALKLAELAPNGLPQLLHERRLREQRERDQDRAPLHGRPGKPDRNWIIARRRATTASAWHRTATGIDAYHDGSGRSSPTSSISPRPTRTARSYTTDRSRPLPPARARGNDRAHRAESLAAMIGEPVIGAGGVIVPPDDYWPRVRELLSYHGILLIADEVITGFGRTGAWFASEEMGL